MKSTVIKQRRPLAMTMRYLMKGGYWKNSEDEILKAAVMKYGLNQWSRISSLLARKSAKQCKARWYEWLDPSIKKTEWTREEEEKLLHLAKIFPSQWRTIAPVVGRTPAQCVEHYENLLDLAQGREERDENDPRNLRPGEIDPAPEIKPARADAKDMDDDEKEQIAETRVRVANNKGKKAKRRAREKFIENTRQKTQLQKQRELRAAGIEYVIEKKKKKKKVEIDYNAEIPFEHLPLEAVYKTGPDEEPKPDILKGNLSLSDIEGVRRDEEEKRLRKIDQKKLKKLRGLELPQHIEKLNKVNPLMYQKKTRLVLADPQLSDKELELLGKMTKSQAENISASTSDVTRELLGNYSVREPTPVKTPKYSSQLMKEAKLAYSMINAPSPVMSSENMMGGLLPEDIQDTPSSKKAGVTPNPYKQIVSSNKRVSRGETPLSSTARGRLEKSTPQLVYNDELNLNNDEWADNAWEERSIEGFSRDGSINKFERIREIIQKSLRSLPEPRNDYEIDLPELDIFMKREKELSESRLKKMDFEDLEEMRAEAKEKQKLKDHFSKTQVIQKELPIPSSVPEPLLIALSNPPKKETAESLIEKEMAQLVINDMVENQDKTLELDASVLALYRPKDLASEDPLEDYTTDDKEKALYMIEKETEALRKERPEGEALIMDLLEKQSLSVDKKLVERNSKELDQVYQSLEKEIKNLEGEIAEELDDEAEKVLQSEIFLLQQEVDKKVIEAEVYEQLKTQEDRAIVLRLHEQDIFIKDLKEKEQKLQKLYRSYQQELKAIDSGEPN